MTSSKIRRLLESRPNPSELSAIDVRIIDELRYDARLPNKTLATRLGIAPSTCHGRVRALEEAGVITGYQTTVDLAACGVSVRALISAQVHSRARHDMIAICDRLRSAPAVLEVFLIGGEQDILVHVACASTEQLRDFVNDHLGNNPAIASSQTSIVFDYFEPQHT